MLFFIFRASRNFSLHIWNYRPMQTLEFPLSFNKFWKMFRHNFELFTQLVHCPLIGLSSCYNNSDSFLDHDETLCNERILKFLRRIRCEIDWLQYISILFILYWGFKKFLKRQNSSLQLCLCSLYKQIIVSEFTMHYAASKLEDIFAVVKIMS